MVPRRPVVSNVISINSVAPGPEPQGPTPVSARARRKSGVNQWTRRNALRRFFLGGAGVWKIQRETGVPTAAIESDLRELGYAEWERQQRRAA